ncbi:ubiquitin domain-containing protein 1 isoform X1 [Lissotriton helveticus]
MGGCVGRPPRGESQGSRGRAAGHPRKRAERGRLKSWQVLNTPCTQLLKVSAFSDAQFTSPGHPDIRGRVGTEISEVWAGRAQADEQGSLTECYDELGNRYQLPVYCLAPPVNLIMERSDEEVADTPEQAPNTRREFQLKVRLSTGKDVKLNASMTDSIGQLKKQLFAEEQIDPTWQRWFFSGKLLTDRMKLQETKIQKDFVVQVIVNQPLESEK